MAKFPLIIFSFGLILSIQFVVGMEDDKIQNELSDKEEEAVFYKVFEDIMETLINDKKVNGNIMETKVIQVEFYEAYEKAKETRHPSSVEVSMEDEKQIFYVTLEYALEMMASSGLIDHDTVYKELFPGKDKSLASKFDKMIRDGIEKARTDDKDYEVDSLKPRTKGKYKTWSEGKYKSRSKGKGNDDSSKSSKGKEDDDDDTSKDRSKGKEKEEADNSKAESKGKRKEKEKEENDNSKAESDGKGKGKEKDDNSKAESKGKEKGKEDDDDNSKAESKTKGKEDEDDNSKGGSKGKEDEDDDSKDESKGKDKDRSDEEGKKEKGGDSDDKDSL